MMISLIAAVSENGVIGKNNTLPWSLPDDLKRFRELTKGKPIIMGWKTFQSIGRPLANRVNIVLSKENIEIPGCVVAHSIEEALRAAGNAKELMVIGGGSVYAQFLSQADRMYLTEIHATIEGDTYFPKFNPEEWEEVERIDHGIDEQHRYSFSFVTLDRKK